MYDLILFLTNKCNLSCDYCPVKKDDEIMDYQLAQKSIDYYLGQSGQSKHIRFFGGEPFLSFDLIKEIVSYANKIAQRGNQTLTFDVTTNGTILSPEIFDFFKNNENIELILSLDGKESDHLKNRKGNLRPINSHQNILKNLDSILDIDNLSINVVLAPNQVRNFSGNFLYLLKLGFRRFNFLPAFFVTWSSSELAELKKQLNLVAKVIKALRVKSNDKIIIKNEFFSSETPLFNQGFIIGCDGDIYLNNMFFTKYFYELRKDYRLGNILNFNQMFDGFEFRNYSQVIKEYIAPDIYRSSLNIDMLLSNFIEKLCSE